MINLASVVITRKISMSIFELWNCKKCMIILIITFKDEMNVSQWQKMSSNTGEMEKKKTNKKM